MKVIIYDIETLKEMFHIAIFNPEDNIWTRFSVNKNVNQLDKFIKWTENYKDYYWVGYNNLRFDSQIIEWIFRNHQNWYDKTSLEICAIIAQKAGDVINDANFNVFPEYRETDLTFKQIDLFTLNHFNNKNRMVSLKRLEFEMDMINVEEMPIHHNKVDLTDQEIQIIIDYCDNDVLATHEFYKITTGNTSHPLYKENNQIQLRLDIEAEFGISCLNYSDSKIGDEMIKKYYCSEKNLEYSNLPKKGTFRSNIALKYCIAPYIKFQTSELKEFLKKIKNISLGMKDDFKESIVFKGNTYSFMKGGIHTENTPKIFESDDENLIIDWDVSSFYPANIINNERYPKHLGKEFLVGYKKMFDRRLELKPLAKKDKKIKGIVNALKLAVNSVYGKSGDMSNWLYDKLLTLFTCVNGELSLLMLIEKYELAGIHVISANTDGVTIRIHKSLLDKMMEINKEWMAITRFELERADYSRIIFSTVNDYIAIKTDGEVKKKGDFVTDFELHKNKSGRIIPMALEKYYVHGIPVEQTIKNHLNIYDFAMRQKSSRDFHYEGVSEGKTTVYNKLIRYYIATKGEKLLKIKNPECKTDAAPVSEVEAGEWMAKVCNYLPSNGKYDDINYDYYIHRCNIIITKIKYESKKKKPPVVIPNQISLF